MASKALLILGLLMVAALFVTSDAGRELAEETMENIEKMATKNGVAEQKGRGGYNHGSPNGGGYNGSGYPESGNIVGGGFHRRCVPSCCQPRFYPGCNCCRARPGRG